MIDKEKLIQLKQLLDAGVITQEEFDKKKKLILGLEDDRTDNQKEEDRPALIEMSDDKMAEEAEGICRPNENELRGEREALIGKNTEHYLPIFEKKDKGGDTGWNWCAFFFSPMWFAYRKMFGWAAIALIAPLTAGFLIGIVLYNTSLHGESIDIIIRVLGLVFNVAFALAANGIYKTRIDKLVSEIPEEDTARTRFIKSKGGVSTIAVVIVIAIYFGISMLFESM